MEASTQESRCYQLQHAHWEAAPFGAKVDLYPCSSLLVLTDGLEDPLGLVLPPDPEEVNGDPAEDDGEADRTFLRCHPEGNSNEKQASQDEENGQADVHLHEDVENRLEVVSGEHGAVVSELRLAIEPKEGKKVCAPWTVLTEFQIPAW